MYRGPARATIRHTVGQLLFEWDADKAHRNVVKHHVDIGEAASAFLDPYQAIFADPEHSSTEERLLLRGQSDQGRLLVVSYTERGAVIRLISARPATPRERRQHAEGQ